jgi:phosphatidylglycerol lysyltransferase
MNRIRAHWRTLVTVAVFAIVGWLLHRLLAEYKFSDVRAAFRQIAPWRIAAAAGLTALNYLVLIGYDILAVRALRHPLSLRKIALASFTGFVTSNNFGALLGGTGVRYRLYSSWGLSTADIVKLVVIVGVAFWIGLFAVAGATFLIEPLRIPAGINLPVSDIRILGGLLLAISVAYLVTTAIRHKPLHYRGVHYELPPFGVAVLQTVVAAADMIIAAATVYVLLPDDVGMSFPKFLPIYLLAMVASVCSHVPGGLGVLELVIISFLPAEVSNAEILARLIAFRVIYFLLPLLVAVVLLVANEVALTGVVKHKAWREIGRWANSVLPLILAGATIICGAILLFSGATPAFSDRLQALRNTVPLPVLETAHFLASLAGISLILAARGLQRRLDAAWWLSVSLLATGIVCSILKGLDFEEATFLAVVLTALLASRKRFYRQGSLVHERFTPGWLATIGLAVACSVWLGMFAHKHDVYSPNLWWEMAFNADAPRFVRATAGVVAVLLFFSLGRLTAPRRHQPEVATAEEVERAATIVAQSNATWPNLALLGDKSLLFSDAGDAFIMYGVQGRSWVAMGDPVGPPESVKELIWKFRQQCDRFAGWPVFYEVSQQTLHHYLDQGFTLLKLGEEARVSLAEFSLEGPSRSKLRQTVSRAHRDHISFEVLPREQVAELLPRMREISDSWLEHKQASEKGFSLGFFDEDYLRRFPLAVVRMNGEMIAFANLWSGCKEELSIDLMRYTPQAPPSVMEYLFIQLLLWGKEQGYQWFNLGMAPLSGIDDRPMSPLWNRAAGAVFRFGDHFYSFQGLRQYKEKFSPVWRSKYLASPGGLTLPRVLTDVTLLIGRKRPHDG